MFDFKNVKQKTLVITGIIFSIVLIVGIAIFFLFKNTTPPKTTTLPKTTTPPKTSGLRPEVYLRRLGSRILPGQFEGIKRLFPNITLATMQQINQALIEGLKVCDNGIAIDNGRELIAFTRSGPGSLNTSSWCSEGTPFVKELVLSGSDSSNIWVFGVKPQNGHVDVYPFSALKWSQHDPLPSLLKDFV